MQRDSRLVWNAVFRVPRAVLRAPWQARTWTGTAHVGAGLLLGVVSAWVLIFLAVLALGLAMFRVVGVRALAVLLRGVRALTVAQRYRFAAYLNVELPAPGVPEPTAGEWRTWVIAQARTSATRRQAGYHLFTGLLATVSLAVIATSWAVGILLTTLPAYASSLPVDGPLSAASTATLTLGGVVCLFGAPWVVRATVTVDVVAARALLRASRSQELASRVEELTESRAAAVEAATEERRRIERDLHDGTQQRLTALAMNLGLARRSLVDLPSPAREVIEQAHDEAKQALTELRGFVRGLHPVTLEDRGLADALRGIAASSPVPVTLEVDVSRRPSSAVETVAYFVVSEALTNVAKHSAASAVDIRVRRTEDRLQIQVRDDGRGGAAVGSGTGLSGLGHRVRSVNGTLRVDSPVGGPTTISVELPCEP